MSFANAEMTSARVIDEGFKHRFVRVNLLSWRQILPYVSGGESDGETTHIE